MAAGTRSILAKALMTTALAVLGSLCLLVTSRALSGIPFDLVDLVECIAFPAIVSMPISWYIFSQAQKLSAAHDQLITLNAKMAEAYEQLRRAHQVISFSSRHDLMTQVLNREHFLQELTDAYSPDGRGVFLMIDADHFKRINDTFGHPKGDEALVLIASSLKRSVRSGDHVGRLGGEEFGVLLCCLSVADAADLAESIRQEVAGIDWRPDSSTRYPLSVSIGGAAFADCPGGVSELLLQADRCLYEAKRAGRNCIAFSYVLSDIAHAMAQRKHARPKRPGR
jgi:diguanylate cyclase (GGDEF)-like protein